MECDEVKKILLDNRFISEIEVEQSKAHNDKSYEILIHCKLEVHGKFIPIVVGIPQDWQMVLFDFYWDGEFPYIPHIDKSGKLCLYDLEGTLIDADFQGLLNQCIDSARTLVIKGESGHNKEDFISEFGSYFAMLPNVRTAKVSVPKIKKSINIKFYEKKITREKKESYAHYLSRENNISYFSSSEYDDFKAWGINKTQQNGIYLYIKPTNTIYPPNFLEFEDIGFVNKLFSWVGKDIFNKIRSKCGRNLFVIFEIEQENKITNCCGFKIENPIFAKKDMVIIKKFDKLIPLSVDRIDTQYLLNRTSFTDNTLENKSFLIIGCGSIGGYVLNNLIKSGCKNITLVDDDILKAENVYRHLLGVEYAELYKSVALANYAEKSIPGIRIKSIVEKIQVAIEACVIELANYDYIISTTGNHNVNLWINKFVKNNRLTSTIFYVWNEVLDIGCHVAVIDSEKKFDYEDLFSRDENGELYDLTSFVMKGQNFTRSYSGCGGTFIPYGSTVSLRSSLLFMDILKQYVVGKIQENVLWSEKGDDFYLKKAGFETSDRYKKQQNILEIKNLEYFRKDK